MAEGALYKTLLLLLLLLLLLVVVVVVAKSPPVTRVSENSGFAAKLLCGLLQARLSAHDDLMKITD